VWGVVCDILIMFGGVSVCSVWESLEWFWWIEYLLCVDRLVWVWESECAAGDFVLGVCVFRYHEFVSIRN
jgi:hypothetical protein